MEMVIQVASAFVGSLGFELLFRVKRDKLFLGALGGALSWIFYLGAAEFVRQEAVCYFISTLLITLYAEILARLKKSPATIFLVPSTIPLIPGGSLYHAMEYTVQGQWEQAASTGKSTLLLAAGIALGMMVGTFIMRSCLVAAKK
ncbi:MAG TPA: threonine/serine exporter family protein [Candidatus Egerieimonas intestinavium]|uniref:Threonine/serine exporter family protein n=1 Tax=Candidatus Egerieimonas intestinavium TaxID=2840777 RepID=A0A9D1EIK2_9FIRM|nr:threonine/serine exporter family protein [Candidatus Egerieimonas intestinavium]